MSDKTPFIDVDEETQRPKVNLFGKTLSKITSLRMAALEDAKRKLLDRHKVTPLNREKYKLVESRTVLPSGSEVIEFRLYELIDAAVVKVDTEVKTELSGGINQLKEFQPYEPSNKNS